jgi:hypothetical protein
MLPQAFLKDHFWREEWSIANELFYETIFLFFLWIVFKKDKQPYSKKYWDKAINKKMLPQAFLKDHFWREEWSMKRDGL